MVARLVAGPTSRNTRAAPGESPLAIIAAAMGVEELAQRYSGRPTTIIASMGMIPDPHPSTSMKKSSGRSPTRTPVSNSPTTSDSAMSSSTELKPYSREWRKRRAPSGAAPPGAPVSSQESSGARVSSREPPDAPASAPASSLGVGPAASSLTPMEAMPATSAVTTATTGRTTAMTGPMRP